MSYGKKYLGQFKKIDGVTCYYDILEEDYSGSITTLKCGDPPVTISQEGSSMDIYNGVVGSSITLIIVADGLDLIELGYARERQFRIDYYENSVLFGQYYLLPGNYEQAYLANKNEVTIIGIDQLGNLKNFLYKRPEGNLITDWETAGSTVVTSDGPTIILAYDTSTVYNYIRTNSFPIKKAEVLIIDVFVIIIAGVTPTAMLSTYDIVGVKSTATVPLAAGQNNITLTASETVHDCVLAFEVNGGITNYATGVVDMQFQNSFRFGYASDMEIITNCLRNTGLELSLHENVNVQDQYQSVARLDGVYSNQEIFLELTTGMGVEGANYPFKGLEQRAIPGYIIPIIKRAFPPPNDESGAILTAWSCYDVIQAILFPYGARIMQRKGAWMITRLDNMRGDASYRKYDENGVYVSASNINPVLAFTAAHVANMIRPVGASARLNVTPGWKATGLIQNYGYKNLIQNGSFENEFLNWDEVNSFAGFITARDTSSNCVYVGLGSGTGATASDPMLDYSIDIPVELNVNRFRLKFDTKCVATPTQLSAGVYVGIRVWVDSAGGDMALQVAAGSESTMTWMTDASNNLMLNLKLLLNDSWQTYELEATSILGRTGTIHIEIHKHYCSTPTGLGTWFDNVEFWASEDAAVVPEEQNLSLTLNENNILIPDERIAYFGDGYGIATTPPDDVYLYKGAKKADLTNNYNTTRWLNVGSGYSTYKTLLGWLNEFMKIMHSRPSQIFRGTIKGNCDVISVYTDSANGNKLFFTNILQEYNPRENTWIVEAIELKPQSFEFSAGFAEIEMVIPLPTIYEGPPPPPDVEVTSVGLIQDGIQYTEMDVYVNYTNSGGAGNVTIYWYIKNHLGTTVDSGNQSVYCVAGSSAVVLTGIYYPVADIANTFFAKETDDATYEESAPFETTT